ncbi:hypothetical protein K7X08_025212 [Anisodus acutangulus]|uniref:Uncharacterized protein n=1 Tax=Anisodus acutangulus TaxID=402998 RepID=A0A9Q1MCD1_9SOLA|nr:hypothetical protein K7X08_025212 [Anisodus acutangulus]
MVKSCGERTHQFLVSYDLAVKQMECLCIHSTTHRLFHGLEGSTAVKAADSGRLSDGNSPGLSGITLDKSVEFTYEELATATNDFSIANKIGQSGFGVVYYAELRGEA